VPFTGLLNRLDAVLILAKKERAKSREAVS